MRWVLLSLVLGGISLVALFVHLGWQRSSERNAVEVARAFNAQIVGSITRELTEVLVNAEAAAEAVRSVLYQKVILSTDEAKREFLFLSQLQAQPGLSWIAYGWPNGDFFGAQKVGAEAIRMVEVRLEPKFGTRKLRIDHYVAEPGDIRFERREFLDSDYFATRQVWYTRAAAGSAGSWSEVREFPTRMRPGIAVSKPVYVDRTFAGVVNVTIELERLTRMLAHLEAGHSGRVYILAPDGRRLAGPTESDQSDLDEHRMPFWDTLDNGRNRGLAVFASALAQRGTSLRAITAPTMVQLPDPATGAEAFVTLSPLAFEQWVVATVIPRADFLREFDATQRRLGYAVLAFLALAVLLVTLFTEHLVTRPIRRVAGQLQHIEQFRLERLEHMESPLREIDDLSATMEQMGRGLASFGKFLPTDLVRTLVAQGVEARPGGRRRELTIYFSDLAGFTRLSEQLGEDIVPILSRYLERMSLTVAAHGGTIDKFIGDALMVFWNAPTDDDAHARHACLAAIACQTEMRRLREEEGLDLHMRIGLNTGSVLVGNFGSESRLNYTAIGDAVNIASRLEAVNKVYGTEIILGESTRQAAGPEVVTRRLDLVAVYGRSGGLPIHELVGIAGSPAAEAARAWIEVYELGLEAYARRDFAGALAAFERVEALKPGDAPARLFARRCCDRLALAPGPDWQPIHVFESK